ncbi:hypothetical protein [Neisseria sp. Ec49-e6-T10]|uniref:hypothetical protein n=1 Tax=Neisseria sp. Ec49-e6-T10 TaxID=3140744 RepID=UPI003EBE9DCB
MKKFCSLLILLGTLMLGACQPADFQKELEAPNTDWHLVGYSDYAKQEGKAEYQETLHFTQGRIHASSSEGTQIWPYHLEGTTLKIIYQSENNEGEVYSIKKDQDKFILEYLGTQNKDKLVKNSEHDNFLELTPIKKEATQ